MRLVSRARLRRFDVLEVEVESLRSRNRLLEHALLRERAETDLQRAQKQSACAEADYWRVRAERFIDQIGLKQGILSAPTMEAEPPASEGAIESVFAALGKSAINTNSPRAAAAPTAPLVTGVDPRAAQAAVDDVLER